MTTLLPILGLLAGCQSVFRLEVAVTVERDALSAYAAQYPLAVTTVLQQEDLITSVLCVPGAASDVEQFWLRRGGCRIPDALLVRVEEAQLEGSTCDIDAAVAEKVPLDPPVERWWAPDATTDCVEGEDGEQVLHVDITFGAEG